MKPDVHVLVVEDSPMVMRIIRHLLSREEGLIAHYAASRAEAESAYAEHQDHLFLALVDLNLPDAPDGEVVDFFLEKSVPTIVLTGSFSEERREALLAKGIVDYITKEGKYSYLYAIRLIHRLRRNEDIRILIADDSRTARSFVRDLLERHRYQVIEAEDGMDAIRKLLDNPDINILIADYNMPRMDGFQLTQLLRDKYEKTDLIILGLSGEGQNSLSAKFIKNGANDFLRKPFSHEEFHCRIMHSVETLELVEQLRQATRVDAATGLLHFEAFKDDFETLRDRCLESSTPLSLALFEIDEFEVINSEQGWGASEAIMRRFGLTVGQALQRFLVGRQIGPRFVAAFAGLDPGRASTLMDSLIARVNTLPLTPSESLSSLAMSGATVVVGDRSLDTLLAEAEQGLRQAREEGGNMMITVD